MERPTTWEKHQQDINKSINRICNVKELPQVSEEKAGYSLEKWTEDMNSQINEEVQIANI